MLTYFKPTFSRDVLELRLQSCKPLVARSVRLCAQSTNRQI